MAQECIFLFKGERGTLVKLIFLTCFRLPHQDKMNCALNMPIYFPPRSIQRIWTTASSELGSTFKSSTVAKPEAFSSEGAPAHLDFNVTPCGMS